MKKLWVILIVLVVAIVVLFFISQLLVSTIEKGNSPADAVTPTAQAPQPTEKPTATPAPDRESGLKFEAGASANDILKALGEPKDKGEFEGSYYLSYGDIIYYVDSMDVATSKVTAIDLLPGQKVYGVKVGMTPAEIKAKLGAPMDESASSEDGSWTLFYQFGDNSVYFSSVDSKSPTDSARVKKED